MVPTAGDTQRADLVFATVVVGAVFLTGLGQLAFPKIATPLLLSALLSYALLPLVDRLASQLPRWLAVALVGLVGAGLLTAVIIWAAPTVAKQLSGTPETLTTAVRKLSNSWPKLLSWLPAPLENFVQRMTNTLLLSLRKAGPSTDTITQWVGRTSSGVLAVASGIVFVPLFAFLILHGYHRTVRRVVELVPERWRPRFEERGAQLNKVLSGFIRGQLLVALILCVLYSLAFSLIGIPLAVVVGIIAGLGELIPYLGGIIAVSLGALLALGAGHPKDVLFVAIAFVVIQSVQGALISPWIVGGQARLGPLTVIVALAIGAQLFGFLGLLLAVPITALLKVAVASAVDAYRQSAFFRRKVA